MKVLYIAGSGRSGSTIVDNILGQLDGWISVGEVRFLWERGMLEDRRCGCGEAFSACPFWRAVLVRAFPDGVDPARMRTLLERGTRARRIPSLLGRARRARFVTRDLDELPATLSALYRAIAEVGGARVIVDSSKLPTYGAVLGEVPEVDLRVVHLVRDPRAAAFSWLRKRELPDLPGTDMQRQGPTRSAALWTLWNVMAEVFWGRRGGDLRIRYEDFVRAPRDTIAQIVKAADEPADDGPFVSDIDVTLTSGHGVAGNPSRFTVGRVALRADHAWQTQMRRADRWKVNAVTWPLLARHRYLRRR